MNNQTTAKRRRPSPRGAAVALAAALAALALAAACASPPAPAARAPAAPAWYLDPAGAYPDDQYLAFMGSGPDFESARADALAQLAGFFGMSVQAVSRGSVEYRDKGSGPGTTTSELERAVSQTVTTQATQKLYAVRYTEPYEAKKTTYLMAWLPIRETIAQVSSERRARLDAARARLALAEGAPSVLERHINALAATGMVPRIEEYDAMLRALRAPVGTDTADLSRRARAALDAARPLLAARIVRDDPEGFAGSLLEEALGSADIKPAPKGALTLTAAARAKPLALATQSDMHTHEWTVAVALADETGAVWFTDQASGRVSGSSDASAKLRAKLEVERFIRERFGPGLRASLLARLEAAK